MTGPARPGVAESNLFGGPPFPATTTLEVVDVAGPDGCVVVEMVTVPDPALLGEILAATLAAQGLPVDPIPPAFEDLTVENRIVASYDYETGYAARVVGTQTFSAGGETRIDTTEIVDVTG